MAKAEGRSSTQKTQRPSTGRPSRRAQPKQRTRGGDRRGSTARWSKRVMQTSNSLDLEPRVFLLKNAREVARSLKRSAEQSRRRRSAPYRSAMSMLTFYINRAGKKLPAQRRRTLERAKDELRSLFGQTNRRRGAAD